MVSKKLFFVFFLLVCYSQTWSQKRNYKTFTEEDGLPSSTIYSIFQDSKGYIWFATDQGVSKYDGYRFNNYMVSDGLSDSEVFNFYEDSFGRIWFYTLNGRVSYYLNGLFYNSSNDLTLRSLDSESMITSIFEDSEKNLWVATYTDGLVKYSLSENYLKKYLQEDSLIHVNGAFVTSDGDISLVASRGIFPFSVEKEEVVYKDKRSVPAKNVNLYNSKYAILSDSIVWISNINLTYESKIENDTLDIVFKTLKQGEYINNLCKIDNEIFICTTEGVTKYSIEKRLFQNTLLDNNVSSVLKDNEGNYWYGTLGQGVLFEPVNNISLCTPLKGLSLSNNIKHIFRSDSSIWFSTVDNQVGYVTRNAELNIIPFKGDALKKCKGVNNIVFEKGGGWLATNLYLVKFEGLMTYKLAITSKDILIEGNSNLWIASTSGLYVIPENVLEKYKNNDFVLKGLVEYRLLEKRIKELFRDKSGNIWIASQGALYVKKERDSTLKEIQQARGKQITSITEYTNKGILLGTTGSGLIGVYGDNAYSITDVDGLSSNVCTSVIVDNDSTIWVATNRGLNKVMGFPNKVEVEYYGELDGIGSDMVNDLLISGDTIWLATNNGLDFLIKSEFIVNKKAPSMLIERVTVNGEPITISESKNIFAYQQNDISISYVGLSPSSGGDVLYRYRLSEESSWRYTRNRSINFSSLSPGIYHFSIAAKGKIGGWSEAKVFHFEVLKPFWQSTAFIVFVIAATILIIWIIVLQILRNHRARNEQEQRVMTSELKSLKAQINPHFIFNALNSIQGELLKKQPETALSYMGKLGRLMREVLDQSDQLYVDVSQEVSIITNYLEMEKFKTGNKFDYSIDVASNVDLYKTKLPSMIIQPFVENSIWHGFSEPDTSYHLSISFDLLQMSKLVIKINDNGIGLKRAKEKTKKSHRSKGLGMVEERLEALNYRKEQKMSFKVEESKNESGEVLGTQVTIIIPQ